MSHPLRNAIFYGLALACLLLSTFAIVLHGRFADCVRSAHFNPNTLTTSEEEIREGCSRTMFPFSFLFL